MRGADLVVLATSSPTPVIEATWVAPGAHVVSVGACRPDQREMAPELVARGASVRRFARRRLVESGDVVMGITRGAVRRKTHMAGELGEVVLGRVEAAQSDDQITIFKSLGMAVEDVVAADLVFRRALETGAGTELTL